MSYDLYLTDPVTGQTLELDEPHQMKGGTYAVGGTTEAHLNVTYNYAPLFARVLPAREWREGDSEHDRDGVRGIRTLYGMTGEESIPLLSSAAAKLNDDVDPYYWKATEGNAKRALTQLLALAQMLPDGVWRGD